MKWVLYRSVIHMIFPIWWFVYWISELFIFSCSNFIYVWAWFPSDFRSFLRLKYEWNLHYILNGIRWNKPQTFINLNSIQQLSGKKKTVLELAGMLKLPCFPCKYKHLFVVENKAVCVLLNRLTRSISVVLWRLSNCSRH